MSSLSRNVLRSSLKNFSAAQKSSLQYPLRTAVTLKNHKYTVQAVAQGKGRNGDVVSDDFKLTVASPKELGGTGEGTNPEQLFAMGYSTCFLGALQAVANKLGKAEMAKNAVVHATVSLGEANEIPGFGIEVEIKVEGIDEELLKAGHDFCPYSRALTRGANVKVSLA
ncbi:OsmC-like protein [Pluteus cervinus]|uniref:OsmC-like protein n=1 Tax=Pluteus cervinus TaxID=181527 RepID=A0ACD3AP43_9AGAR|nr:OsmC-like protein [Pluteus cervinus]